MIDGALTQAEACELQAEMQRLLADGGFTDASTLFRSDRTRFLSEEEAEQQQLPALAAAIRLLKGVAYEVADATDGVDALTSARSVQAACYPGGGASYAAHSDVRDDDAGKPSNWRRWTCILYANEGWRPEHGGALRLHAYAGGAAAAAGGRPAPFGRRGASGAAAAPAELLPHGGRLLVFDSRRVHEVLPAYRERFACTMWLWRESDDEEAYFLS